MVSWPVLTLGAGQSQVLSFTAQAPGVAAAGTIVHATAAATAGALTMQRHDVLVN